MTIFTTNRTKGVDMKMQDKFKIGDFVIVNTFDRPMSMHIARVISIYDDYIAAEYCNIKDYPVMDGLMTATLVSDFGQDVVFDGDKKMFCAVPNGNPCIATYDDGTPRKWQEDAYAVSL